MVSKEILDTLQRLERKLDELGLMQKSIMDLREASKYSGWKPSYLYKLTSTNQIPHYRPRNGKLRFRREELDSYMLGNGCLHKQETGVAP
jgi:excisionase family DNA binding protein